MDRDAIVNAAELRPWYKKDVVLDGPGLHLELAVSQELFSSHDIDSGSRLLIRALEDTTLPNTGNAVDYGCGYGVLGLAIAILQPTLHMTFVDRDALATAFAAWNLERQDAQVRERSTIITRLDIDERPVDGWDLVLWNVPGKVGVDVLRGLATDVAASLAPHGLVALVVVNPLVDVLVESLVVDPSMTTESCARHADHSVILARRSSGPLSPGITDAFARGRFDRSPQRFEYGDIDWELTPVIGLPEYESLSFATVAAIGIAETLAAPIRRIAIQRPGQGHIAVAIAKLLKPRELTLIDRDLLALRATGRAIEALAVPDLVVTFHAQPDLDVIVDDTGLAVLLLDDPVQPAVLEHQMRNLAEHLVKRVIVAGSSTGVTRVLSFVRKHGGWKLRSRIKRSGSSGALLERSSRA